MQQFTLRPGLLTFRGAAGEPMVYDAHHDTVHCGHIFARLSPQEYTLVLALLRQRERAQSVSVHSAPLCVTVKRLCALSGSKSEQSIHHALNKAKQKVEALGLQVIRLHNRYLVLFETEVEGDSDEEEESPLVMVSR